MTDIDVADFPVAVIGGGVMGNGIALNVAMSGFDVAVVETDEQARTSFNARLRRAYQLARFVAKPGSAAREPFADIAARIRVVAALPSRLDVAIAIECITENVASKARLYRALEDACPPRTLFATNTSCISVATIDTWTQRADRTVGIHFMNPAAVRDAVELIRGPRTSDQTIDAVAGFLGRLGKRFNVVNDATGFVINRVLMVAINEAIGLVERGVASAADVDALFVRCLGHQTGPLATADLIGLDVIRDSLIVLRDESNDRFYEPKALLSQLVAAGSLGHKTGTGFHTYRERKA
ncbi:3-hydroxyacyl-CoA dehydrogenase family protein [Burkholderia contaminans]|uniref:3-hydroxyacyl-CoA dehydrogenase family protein n=1 Tax=Burkholderia contaminans TaxID=488447 RepID=UPI00158B5D17|nr:3-hydroxyacyl-CoA dehydrogenase family protein [Burkholderia contaminans]